MDTKQISILLLEDDAAHAEAIRRTFESDGTHFKIKVVGSLREYHESIALEMPDIAFLDMVLPDGNAMELLTSPQEVNSFPMLILTSHGNEQAAVAAMKAGALDYIVKSPETFENMPHFLTGALSRWELIRQNKRAEQALRESEENFRNSIDNSPMGVRIVTTDGKTIYANNAMLGIYGYKNMEEFRAKSIKERYTTESYTGFLERKEKRERGEYVSSDYEINIIRKDGVIRHLEVFRKEVLWGGEPQFQMLYRDITEQKLAEGALKESERKLHELVETAQEGILTVNNESRITFINQRMGEILGYAVTEMVGKYPFDFLDENGKEIIRQELERRRLGIKDEYDIEYLHKDGRHVNVRVGATPLYDINGKYNGSMAVMVDISALKQAEEHILHLNSVLTALSGDFPYQL